MNQLTAAEMIGIHAQFADLKHIDYRNTLAIVTLIELLIEKGAFTREEFSRKSSELDGES